MPWHGKPGLRVCRAFICAVCVEYINRVTLIKDVAVVLGSRHSLSYRALAYPESELMILITAPLVTLLKILTELPVLGLRHTGERLHRALGLVSNPAHHSSRRDRCCKSTYMLSGLLLMSSNAC